MDFLKRLYELYANLLKWEELTTRSLNFTEFQEKLLQQYTTDALTKELKKRLDNETE